MAYLYRHIRPDTNQPFYIGVGLKDNDNHKRATSFMNRNIHWKRIVQKAGAFQVDILFDDISIEEANKKEVEFISLYGRVLDGGILCNMTLGGGGTIGISGELHPSFGKKRPMKYNMLQSEIMKVRANPKNGNEHHLSGKKHTIESLNKNAVSQPNKRAVYKCDMLGNILNEYQSLSEASRDTGIAIPNICRACKTHTYKGYRWIYKDDESANLMQNASYYLPKAISILKDAMIYAESFGNKNYPKWYKQAKWLLSQHNIP